MTQGVYYYKDNKPFLSCGITPIGTIMWYGYTFFLKEKIYIHKLLFIHYLKIKNIDKSLLLTYNKIKII